MIRRTFSGVSQPIHCQHTTHGAPSTAGVTACELDECRGAARVAKQSGHPAFECIHLQSIQYAQPYSQPVTLSEHSLNDLVGQKVRWFKETRKHACLSLKERADNSGNPLIVKFPRDEFDTSSQRFSHFSIFDGEIHYWSRFGRVIVGYDSLHNRWTCACSRSKINCVHKSVAKWFIYQFEPCLLSEVSEGEDHEDGQLSDEEDPSAMTTSAAIYPPTGAVFEEMIRYQHTMKRLPSSLPGDLLCYDARYPRSLIPCEEVCHVCHSPLGDPREISNRAMIISLTKVVTGTQSLLLFYKYDNKNYPVRHCIRTMKINLLIVRLIVVEAPT